MGLYRDLIFRSSQGSGNPNTPHNRRKGYSRPNHRIKNGVPSKWGYLVVRGPHSKDLGSMPDSPHLWKLTIISIEARCINELVAETASCNIFTRLHGLQGMATWGGFPKLGVEGSGFPI